MYSRALSLLQPVFERLTQRPSPGDVMATVRATGLGAITTVAVATVYASTSLWTGSWGFVALWWSATLGMCIWMARKTKRAAQIKVDRVSPRAARRLVWMSFIMALPWVTMSFYAIAFAQNGDPTVIVLAGIGALTASAFILYRTLLAASVFFGSINLALTLSAHLAGWSLAWPVTGYATIYCIFLIYLSFLSGEMVRERDAVVEKLSTTVAELHSARDENYALANIDQVTGLLNRHAFSRELEASVADGLEDGVPFFLLTIDLDRFKNVNDAFGHMAGDELLMAFGKMLDGMLGRDDVVARLGGDEFAVILKSIREEDDLRQVCRKLVERTRDPIILSRCTVHTGATLGASAFPLHGNTAEELMVHADLALSQAKEAGRGQMVFYNDTLRQDVQKKDQMAADVSYALQTDGLFLTYQPQIDLRQNRCIGVEALLRLRRPDGRVVPPNAFLAVAADRGLMNDISQTVFELVGQDLGPLAEQGTFDQRISLNLHSHDFKFPDLLSRNLEYLAQAGLDQRYVTLEITEEVFLGRGMDHVLFVIDELAERGYSISLDDFGTGHASLSHLKRLPLAEIKIDKSFLAGVETCEKDRAIVAAIADLAQTMGARSVAEGIETDAQRSIAMDLGVGTGQGFFWSQPLEIDDLCRWSVANAADGRSYDKSAIKETRRS